jgi:hypothetical protein
MLAVYGSALTVESTSAIEAAEATPAFTTSLQIPRGMDPGAHSWLGSSENCQDANGLIMAYGNDGLNPFLQWNFYEDGLYFRIENDGLKKMGCNGNAWLKPRTDCNDTEVRREANYSSEAFWSVDPTGSGTYLLTSYWKDLNCMNKHMGTISSGNNFIFSVDDGSGLQHWAFNIPVKSKQK